MYYSNLCWSNHRLSLLSNTEKSFLSHNLSQNTVQRLPFLPVSLIQCYFACLKNIVATLAEGKQGKSFIRGCPETFGCDCSLSIGCMYTLNIQPQWKINCTYSNQVLLFVYIVYCFFNIMSDELSEHTLSPVESEPDHNNLEEAKKLRDSKVLSTEARNVLSDLDLSSEHSGTLIQWYCSLFKKCLVHAWHASVEL